MAYHNITKKNFSSILNEIDLAYNEADKEEKQIWINSLNDLLDELLNNDFFGTEGQNDPRGDHRS